MFKKSFVVVLLIVSTFFLLTGCDQLYFKDYEASGTVEDSSGAGIENASVNFSDGSSVKTLTDGSWKQTGLNGDIEITPKKSGYTFSPSSFHLSQLDDNKDGIVFNANSNGTDSGDDSDNSGGDDGSDENNDDSDGNNSDNDSDGTEEEIYTASGIVTSNSGELIPEVELIFSDGSDSVKTGTDGVWEKTGLSGDVTVTPEIEGWQFEPANKTLNADNTIVDFTASPAEDYSHYSLSGVIYNNDNLNLTITFEKDDGTVINRTLTDKDGSWKVNHVWGKVNIKPQTKATIIGYEPDVHFASVEDDNIKFEAIISDKSYTASGIVLDEEDNPIENVTIRFNDGEFSSVKTNAAGEWIKEGLLNQVDVSPLKTGYSFNPESLSVATADENVDFTAKVLEKAYRVNGTVLDREDNPLEDVIIRFNNGEFSSVSTAADGSWESGELTGEVNVSAMKTGYTFSPDSLSVSTADEFVDFTAEAEEQPYTASGEVVDNNGDPLVGVTINLSDGTSVETGTSGTWEQTGLVGEVTVTPKLENWTFDPANKTVDKANPYANFEANPQSYTVSGLVEDEAGNGIEGVTIRFNNGGFSSVSTAADGSWESGELTGEVNVSAMKTGYTFSPDSLSVSTADEFVDFTAEAEEQPYTASGKVEDNNGDPLVGATLNFSDGTSVETASDGNWEKTGLVGEVTVTPELDDWQFVPANITLNEDNNIADFTAQPAEHYDYYTLSGVIEDNGGANIHIEIRRSSDNTLVANAITEDDGSWISTSVWGSVIVTPQTTGSIRGFTPNNQSFSGPETEVNFRADY